VTKCRQDICLLLREVCILKGYLPRHLLIDVHLSRHHSAATDRQAIHDWLLGQFGLERLRQVLSTVLVQ